MRIGFTLAVLTTVTLAQTTTPVFDVASLKSNKSGIRGASFAPPRAGKVQAQNVTLRMLLEEAFHLHTSQIEGPGWIDSERYDVVAKAEGNPDKKQTAQMLQQLLIERFAMKSHWISKDMTIYQLKVAKGGSKLKASDGRCATPKGGTPCGGFNVRNRTEVTGYDVSIADFADMLALLLRRVVVDETGLAGTYDIEAKWSPDDFTSEANVPEAEQRTPYSQSSKRNSGCGSTRQRGQCGSW